MKHPWKRRLTALLLCAICAVGTLPVCISDAASSTTEIRAMQDRIAALEREQKEYEDKIAALNRNAAGIMEKKVLYEKQIASVAQKIDSTERLIAQYDALISDAGANIDTKRAAIDEKFGEFLDRLRIGYEDGFVNYLVLMFESKSLTEFLQNTERTADILSYDRALMDDLEEEKNDLESSRQQLESARREQQEAMRALENDRATLNEKKQELEDYLSGIRADQAKAEQMLSEAQKATEELNKKLEEALAALAQNEVVQHPVAGGALIWPLSVKYNTVSSPFGWRTLNGRPDFHYGIDIPAPAGSNVYAAQAGVVEYAEEHYSYGNFVVINHGGGYATLYAHNTSLAVKVGQTVEQGQVIAYVGQTGNAYGNHCHFEVRYNGKVQDPLGFVTKP